MLHGEYGVSDVYMSVPFILNRNGLAGSVTPKLSDEEVAKFSASAKLLKDTIANIKI